MPYTIEQIAEARDPFGAYRYRIFRDGQLMATWSHDVRGDDHRIDFVGGWGEEWPVGRVTEFLAGGAGQPFRLTKRAIEYLDAQLSTHPQEPRGPEDT